jgi:uncharacterized membrane protein (UPF0127 family)
MKVGFFLALIVLMPVIQPTVTHEGSQINVEIADSPDERQKGLMNRKKLSESSGMLFVYGKEGSRSFWMKNTSIPLDIIFLNSDMEVINIEEADPEPDVTVDSNYRDYLSERPAKYVLEINQNRSGEIGIKEGEKLNVGWAWK